MLPQVGVGVKMDDVQVGEAAQHRPHRTQRDQMLAPQQQRQLVVPQDFRRPGFNVVEGAFGAAKAEFQVAAVKDVKVGQVGVLVGTVRLQPKALVPDGGRPEPRAGPEAGGGVKGRAVEHNVRRAVAAVAPQKGFHIAGKHHSTSRSISSRKAGR